MLLFLIVLLVILGIAIILFANCCELFTYDERSKSRIKRALYYFSDEIKVAGGIITSIFGVILFIMLVCLMCEYMGANSFVAASKEHYKALTYKVENDEYRDEFGLLSKEVIDEVQIWNEDVARRQSLQNDFWLGVFYSDIYDQFETIDYEKFVK